MRTEIKISEEERDLLYKLLTERKIQDMAQYTLAVKDWSANESAENDRKCIRISAEMDFVDTLLVKLGFEVKDGRAIYSPMVASDG